jgi:hypothetical protein
MIRKPKCRRWLMICVVTEPLLVFHEILARCLDGWRRLATVRPNLWGAVAPATVFYQESAFQKLTILFTERFQNQLARVIRIFDHLCHMRQKILFHGRQRLWPDRIFKSPRPRVVRIFSGRLNSVIRPPQTIFLEFVLT